MDRAIVVSADGHASMPPQYWSEYLESGYHEYLPQLIAENEISTKVLWLLNNLMLTDEAAAVFDEDGVYRAERWAGLWDRDVRLAEMDREGVAAEMVYFGDFRTQDPFFNVMNGYYPLEVIDAGVRAYDRWAADTFGAATDRLLLSGGVGTVADVAGTIAELEWIAERGFVGTYAPGFVAYPHLPPLYDDFWEPVWAAYADLGLTLVVHGGYGFPPGTTHATIAEAYHRVKSAGGSDMDLVIDLTSGIFNDTGFFKDLRCRRAMAQLMLGGVFDRHPGLKLMMTEVRGDWIPAALGHLDGLYEARRGDLPAKQMPSEYWQSNCLAGLSFMHRSEVEHRHDIGIDTIDFGRDYPHTESTWPNTHDYYKLLFSGVVDDDVRKILGENAIRFFGLDRAHLAEIASRIGPELSVITAPDAVVDPALVEHLQQRCGVLKPFEGDEMVRELDDLVADDLVILGAGR
jgi:predicted TIM-barrel fold metal-dependent hydrolase